MRPIKSEAQVLPVDTTVMGWSIDEAETGYEIYKDIVDSLQPLKNVGDISHGDIVFIPFLGSYVKSTVYKDEYDGELYAINSQFLAMLDFGEDSRQCWCASGFIDASGMNEADE